MATTKTAAETLAQLDREWAELDGTVRSLSERDLTEIHDPAGWSAKDHLMHVALWERSLLATADGAPRHAALGVDPSTDASEDYDAINAAIFQATRHRPLPEGLDALRSTHAATRARLAAIASAGSAPAGAAASLLADVPGYADHYGQHRGWILELVGRRAS